MIISISAHRKWKYSTVLGSYESLECLDCWISNAWSFGLLDRDPNSVLSTFCSSSGFYFSVGDDTILVYIWYLLCIYFNIVQMFFLFSLFFIFFFIYLLFGCSMFGFLPTSERGQETPTFWPLLPCPEEEKFSTLFSNFFPIW